MTFKDHPTASGAAIKTLLLREMLACGVLVVANHAGSYSHDEADIHLVLGAYEHALASVREALSRGDLMRRIGNQVIQPVFQVRSVN